MALENFKGRGETSLHGGMQFQQNPNRFRISSKGSKQNGLTKLTQHGAHVWVRRVEVNGAIRALECRILAE